MASSSFLILAVSFTGITAEPVQEDNVLLVQHRAQADYLATSIVDPEVTDMLMGVMTALHLEISLVQHVQQFGVGTDLAFSRELDSAASASYEEGNCTKGDLALAKTMISRFLSSRVLRRPPECPGHMVDLMGHLNVCLQRLLFVSPGCARCQEAFTTSLPACLQQCGSTVYACKETDILDLHSAENCRSKVSDCVRCASPAFSQNLRCSGMQQDMPEKVEQFVSSFSADKAAKVEDAVIQKTLALLRG